MGVRELIDDPMVDATSEAHPKGSPLEWAELLAGPPRAGRMALPSVVVGELVAIVDGGRTPLVLYAGQAGSAAIRASTVIDLHGAHIGQSVTLLFEDGDATRPIVTGVIRRSEGWPLKEKPAQVEVDADGERMIVSAKEQLVLRCGKASITLTRAGKVLIEGSYVSSRSTGVNCVRGGSIQLN
jgi:hypothetical protein